MTLEYEYSKTRLPKKSDEAYPLKKQDIDTALKKAGVMDLGQLFFSTRRRPSSTEGHPVIAAWLPGESRSGYWAKSKPFLRLYAVPKIYLENIRNLMNQDGILLKLAKWLVDLETASNVVRSVLRERYVLFLDGKLIVVDENTKRVRLP